MFANSAIDRDSLAQEKIHRRRVNEKERAARIFDTRQRVMGVDVRALDQQLLERRQQKQRDEDAKRNWDGQALQVDFILRSLDEAERMKKRQEDKHISEFNHRLSTAASSSASSFDQASSLGEYGISSCQKFAGEDETKVDRLRDQQRQMQTWRAEHLAEKERLRKEKDDARRVHEAGVFQVGKIMDHLEQQDQHCRRGRLLLDAEININLAREQRQERERLRSQETEEKMGEIIAMMNSNFLCETSSHGVAKNSHMDFKGLSVQEREAIIKEQESQRRERDQLREAEKEYEQEYAKLGQGIHKVTLLQQRALARKLRENTRALAQENLRMADEDRGRRVAEKQFQQKGVEPEWFNGWNTSAR